MKKYITILAVLLAYTGAFAADPEWELVCDGVRTAPLSQVVCFMTSDSDELLTVVLTEGSIDGVRIAAVRDRASVGDIVGAPSAPRMLEAGGILRISNCRQGAAFSITALDGRTLLRRAIDGTSADIDISHLDDAVYVATIDGHSVKFIKK